MKQIKDLELYIIAMKINLFLFKNFTYKFIEEYRRELADAIIGELYFDN